MRVWWACALCAAFGCGGGGTTAGAPATAGGSAVVSAGSAAQAGSTAPAPKAATFTEIYDMLFPRVTNAHCDMCHGLPAFDRSNGNLSTGMDKASTYAALASKASTSSMCNGRMFVVPGQPEMSLLLQKVLPNPPCGLRMPNGGAALSDAQIEMIRSWIAAGAHDD
jgi:hypothetical protein